MNFAAVPCTIANSNKVAGCACLTGYKGSITWVGVTASGTCTRTQCTGTNADAPANGKVSLSDGNRHGSKATFSCKAGFKQGGTMSITCDAKAADAPWPSPSAPPSCTGW